jgi:hypothetical protein
MDWSSRWTKFTFQATLAEPRLQELLGDFFVIVMDGIKP